ncbi:MAG: zinc ribbon domain-containing protein [Nitrospirae bacterium]|nr:zinc ribbon domain-containing protein [Nitrospirota bacterium]
MPIYEYNCLDCGREFMLFQKMGASESDSACPQCKSTKVKKLISSFSCSSDTSSVPTASTHRSGGM